MTATAFRDVCVTERSRVRPRNASRYHMLVPPQPIGENTHEHDTIVTIGDDSPHSGRVLPYLAPHCPTTIRSLPETVRSGTGSVNPKPPAHGALAGSNQPWFLQGTRCDDPKTIEPVSAPNWHRFFAVYDVTIAATQSLGRTKKQ